MTGQPWLVGQVVPEEFFRVLQFIFDNKKNGQQEFYGRQGVTVKMIFSRDHSKRTHKCIISNGTWKTNFNNNFSITQLWHPKNPKGVEIAFIKNQI